MTAQDHQETHYIPELSEGSGDLVSRFWSKVDKSGECWMWTGAINRRGGYGAFTVMPRDLTRSQGLVAHRVAYELLVGVIPAGMELDHLCRVKLCVNPTHLEAVTHAENVARGLGATSQSRKTHCPHGHPYDEANTYRRPRSGHRTCRTCSGQRARSRRAS